LKLTNNGLILNLKIMEITITATLTDEKALQLAKEK
jgi:hypothetical protein